MQHSEQSSDSGSGGGRRRPMNKVWSKQQRGFRHSDLPCELESPASCCDPTGHDDTAACRTIGFVGTSDVARACSCVGGGVEVEPAQNAWNSSAR